MRFVLANLQLNRFIISSVVTKAYKSLFTDVIQYLEFVINSRCSFVKEDDSVNMINVVIMFFCKILYGCAFDVNFVSSSLAK